jgi:hypothetical protein
MEAANEATEKFLASTEGKAWLKLETTRRLVLAGTAVLMISGCASLTPRDDPPDLVLATSRPAAAVSECLTAGLNAEIVPVHRAVALADGSHEIGPTRSTAFVGEDAYFVNVAETDRGTIVELYALGFWVDDRCVNAVG